jgi:hypothetical protein
MQNDEIATQVARNKAQKHFLPEYASDEDYQFSVHMLILAQVHHALIRYKLSYPDLVFEMKNVSGIIVREMRAAGFVLEDAPPPLDTR